MHAPNSETEDVTVQTPRARFSSAQVIDSLTERAKAQEFLPGERKVIEQYFTKPEANVLDVGCGAGRVANLLQNRGFNVIGIDISRPLIEQAQSEFPEIDFIVDDISNSGLASEMFDYAIFSDIGLDYLQPEQKRLDALEELYRLLQPSGILAFSSHNSWATVSHLLVGELSGLVDRYITHGDQNRFWSRYKTESVEFGKQRVYFTNPVRQWFQLRKCGFALLDVVGKRDSKVRYFERSPYYVAKK